MAKKAATHKPSKPYPDFPLFAHAAGVWAKKIKGKLHYFGPWNDPNAALARYLGDREALHAGRTPRAKTDGLTLKELLNRFMTAKMHLRDNGEIAVRTFDEYYKTCERVGETFGVDRLVNDIASSDFQHLRTSMAKQWGPVRLGNEIQRVRGVFNFGYDEGLIDKPVRYGQSFKKPSRKTIRQVRSAKPEKMLESDEIKAILGKATQPMHAMILLAVNMGFGNNDVATLSRKAIDSETGWIRHPRPKTGIVRRAIMWPETAASLKVATAARPKPKEAEGKILAFITKYGHPWSRRNESCPVSKEFKKLLTASKIDRNGVGFYTLRHVFATIGSESRDQIAVDYVMGHVPSDSDMSSRYRERISDERLVAVTDHIRNWLFPQESPRK